MPHTYKFLEEFKLWLSLRGRPLTILRWERVRGENAGKFIALHDQCLNFSELPSKAYGYAGCTSKWKQYPIENYVRDHLLPLANGGKVTRWIGYDADEPRRVKRMMEKRRDDPLFDWQAPLFDWGINRDRCVEIIKNAGLSLPGKSSCFMCPSMRKQEILDLKSNYPDIFAKALEIEDKARPNLTDVKGLGRSFSWRDFAEGQSTASEVIEQSCGCHDDSSDREED